MMTLICCVWRPTQTWDGVSAPLYPFTPPPLASHSHLRSKWMTPAGVAWLMLRPARWHWQLNYPTGRGSWLSAEKSSGPPRLPPPQLSNPQSLCSPLCPLPRPPVTPCQERDAFPELATRVLLTGNLNSNNYHHYWCHKQVADPKPGQ